MTILHYWQEHTNFIKFLSIPFQGKDYNLRNDKAQYHIDRCIYR